MSKKGVAGRGLLPGSCGGWGGRASLEKRALLDSGDGMGEESVGGSEGRAAGAHREECSCNGSCSCSPASALPDAGASSWPPAFADSEMGEN